MRYKLEVAGKRGRREEVSERGGKRGSERGGDSRDGNLQMFSKELALPNGAKGVEETQTSVEEDAGRPRSLSCQGGRSQSFPASINNSQEDQDRHHYPSLGGKKAGRERTSLTSSTGQQAREETSTHEQYSDQTNHTSEGVNKMDGVQVTEKPEHETPPVSDILPEQLEEKGKTGPEENVRDVRETEQEVVEEEDNIYDDPVEVIESNQHTSDKAQECEAENSTMSGQILSYILEGNEAKVVKVETNIASNPIEDSEHCPVAIYASINKEAKRGKLVENSISTFV